MKNTKYISFLSLALFTILFAASTFGEDATTTQAPSFETTKTWGKLDSNMQQAWLTAQKDDNMEARLDCFVRGQQYFDEGDKSFLISQGFYWMQASGNIARGYVKANDLQNIAQLPFVTKISLIVPKVKKSKSK
ncbi:MAG: hypothetical protein ABIE74_08920 [Pseudomonadota bacterium]